MELLLFMKEHLKTVRIKETCIINEETGEVKEEVKHDKIVVGNSGEFYQVYATLIEMIEKLKPVEAKVFISLFKYANSENLFALTKSLKLGVANRNNMCLSAVNNSLTTLVKRKLLIRIDRATYRIHPKYFWKSSVQNRKAVLKYVLEVECPEKECVVDNKVQINLKQHILCDDSENTVNF